LPQRQRETMSAEFGQRPLSTSLFCVNFGLKAKPETVGLKDYSSIVLPESMTRFAQYGDGAQAMSADPSGSLPLYSIANFTRWTQACGTSRRFFSACSGWIASATGAA